MTNYGTQNWPAFGCTEADDLLKALSDHTLSVRLRVAGYHWAAIMAPVDFLLVMDLLTVGAVTGRSLTGDDPSQERLRQVGRWSEDTRLRLLEAMGLGEIPQ